MVLVVATVAAYFKYPIYTALSLLTYLIGRLLYTIGYLSSAKGRYLGALIMDLALIALIILAFTSAVKIAQEGFGVETE